MQIIGSATTERWQHQGEEANEGLGKGSEIQDDPPELPDPEAGEGVPQRRSGRFSFISEPEGGTFIQGADPGSF